MSKLSQFRRAVLPVAAVLIVSMFVALPGPAANTVAAACPPGFITDNAARASLASGDVTNVATGACTSAIHPESYAEKQALDLQRFSMQSAPDGIVPAGAYGRAYRQRQSMLRMKRKAPYTGSWEQVGQGPLQAGDDGYGISGVGLVELSGRVSDFTYVPSTDKFYPDTLFAATSQGGVWMADSSANNWVSIGDSLPTQVIGSVAYTPVNGGTIIVLSGDGSYGAYSRQGAGVFYTSDGGRTWHQGAGLPEDVFGFKLAVDDASKNVVYAATGGGLFRSTDAGKTWANAKLPTGDGAAINCTAQPRTKAGCEYANMVTDVAVIEPGGSTNEAGHKVLATVGWRGGQRRNPTAPYGNGAVQSPNNGIFVSDTGAPGTFAKQQALGFAPQSRIGRIQIGAAIGPSQNHNYIYAMVQDAVLLRRGVPYIDAPVGPTPVDPVTQQAFDHNFDETLQVDSINHGVAKQCQAVNDAANGVLGDDTVPYQCAGGLPVPTVFNGVYVSPDWGQHWSLMEDAQGLQNPATGSALAGYFQLAGAYGPGVQAWYNMWVKPDPTQQIGGVPTRVLMGLEEVWETDTRTPQTGPTSFHVIGRYFSGDSCQALNLPSLPVVGIPPCPTNARGGSTAHETTTHPDQHAAVFVPTSDGNLRVVVGNDGGVYSQRVDGGSDFNNTNWGIGNNRGFNTLQPYDAQMAADGTTWMGLQDNGTAKIYDVVKNGRTVQRQRITETVGGDGFFVGVAPHNGNVAYEEYVGGAISATTDGGHSWTSLSPPISNAQFSTPFVVDPTDPDGLHLMVAGRQVVETTKGAGTTSDDWKQVVDLGSYKHPGDPKGNANGVDIYDPVNSMTAIDLYGDNAYVGFCGTCDVLNNPNPFSNGIATNVGGSKKPKRGTSDGWHVIKRPSGLPNRYITSLAIDPKDPKTVYATLGGYLRQWTAVPGNATPPGHLYVSRDAGKHWHNVSANLPDMPANWVIVRGSQQIVATDIGVFVSDPSVGCNTPACPRFQVLGNNLPMAPVMTIHLAHGDPNLLVAATMGRGVYSYRLGPAPAKPKKVAVKVPAFHNSLVIPAATFETDASGWAITSGGGGFNAQGLGPDTGVSVTEWRHVSPGSGGSAGAMAAEPYSDNTQTTLTSPKLTLPAASLVQLQWDERRDSEPGFDYMTVSWSSDGKHWQSVYGQSGQNPAFPNFTPVSAEFVAPKGTLWVRYSFSADAGISSPPYTGVAIDNVLIKR